MPKRVQFADEIEPLVQFIEDTDPSEIVPGTLARLRAGVPPQQYYEQLAQAGLGASVYGDVRRGKALESLLQRITIKDSSGSVLSLADLQGSDEDEAEHNHED